MPSTAPPATEPDDPPGSVTPRRVTELWLPLAASWLLMGVELPMLTAVVARMPLPDVQLAAFGSIAFPVSLVIEGPIIMMLAASTALCTDWESYRRVLRFTHAAGLALTLVHAAIAFTPLYDLVAVRVLGALPEVIEPGRLALRLMLPWTWAIAYRRFQQGVLIRHGASRAVAVGTGVRLATNAALLLTGVALTRWPGAALGAGALAAGVVTEALYTRWRVQPVLEHSVRPAPARGTPLTVRHFLAFYIPLAMTPLITLVVQPIASAAMYRMPAKLTSAAAWPAVHGLVFITRSMGFAYNEVVVTLIGEPGSVPALRTFHRRLAVGTVGLLALVAFTPLAGLWYGTVSGLSPELTHAARLGVACSVLMPGYQVFQSWYQGALVKQGKTRAIIEAVALYCVVCVSLLTLGTYVSPVPGLYWALCTFVVAGLTQTAWLRVRSAGAIREFASA